MNFVSRSALAAAEAAREAAPVRLLALSPTPAPFTLDQTDVIDRARRLFGPKMGDFERLARVFETTGIKTRQGVKPADWYHGTIGWPERTEAYLETGTALFVEAAGRALAEAGLAAGDVDTVVTVSSTGIATPSLEARALQVMDFRPDVKRVPVFGLGCAGGVSGLSLAARLARAEPGSVVLLVAIELCTLAIRSDRADKADLVATALFGDGAAGAVLQAGGAGEEAGAPIIAFGHEHTWRGTLDIMGWSVDPVGFGVIFDRAIPPFVAGHYREAMDEALREHGLTHRSVDRFVCHPGGTKVVAALEKALDLDEGSLDAERETLSRHGNMSAPTALFVLRRVLDGGFSGRAVLSALGPGFTASFVGLEVAPALASAS